jgi:PAS domain S-box-containing protein
LRILLIDDDQGDFEMTRVMLRQIERPEVTLDWVPSYHEGIEAVSDPKYDLVIVDYFLEDCNGLDLLREARRRGTKVPMIMLTGRGSKDVDVEAMEAGAVDYLVKGQIEAETLERAIRYAIDRAESETALRESEAKHRGMFDHLPFGLYRCDGEGRFLEANPALLRILGRPDLEALAGACPPAFLVNPEDLGKFKIQLEQFGVVKGFETTLERQDGSSVRVRNTARVLRGVDGHISSVEGGIEEQPGEAHTGGVAREAARYRTAFEILRAGIAFVNMDGKILEANPALANAMGTDPDGLTGMSLTAIFGAEEGPRVLAELASIESGGADRIEAKRQLRATHGEGVWTNVVMAPILDLDGSPDHFMVLFEDL